MRASTTGCKTWKLTPMDLKSYDRWDAYTKALLKCRPELEHRPMRLPVIDDFMGGQGPQHAEERPRGIVPTDPVILEVKNLGKSFHVREGLFGKREFKAVADASFALRRGKTLGLVGESGSGKTTVGLTLMRLHQATTGQALFDGKDILSMSEREFMPYKRRIQIIFQNPYASLNPRFTVGQILTEPLAIHGIGANAQERTDLVFELLGKVGLPDVSFYKYPHEFSGGQRQRIAIARALAAEPHLIVADNPKFQDALTFTISGRASSDGVQPQKIVGMHPCAPIFARNLAGALGQPINGCTTW